MDPSGQFFQTGDGINSKEGVHASMLFASLISATDPVATLTVLSSPTVNADPNLQAILFGESVLNDAIAIVLFRTLEKANTGGAQFVSDFFKVSLGATLIGFAVALALSCILRHGSFHERSTHIEVRHAPCFLAFFSLAFFPRLHIPRRPTTTLAFTHTQVTLTVGAGYFAYALAEVLNLSGVLALFFCALLLGHYNWCVLQQRDARAALAGCVLKALFR